MNTDYEDWLDSDDEDYSRPQKIKSKKPKDKDYVKKKKNDYRKERLARQKERDNSIKSLEDED